MAVLHDPRRAGSESEEPETVARSKPAAAPQTPQEHLLFVQKGLGNAAASQMLARDKAPPTVAPPEPKLTDDEEVASAKEALVNAAVDAAADLVGSRQKYDGKTITDWIPGILTARIIKGAKKPKSKAGNPLAPLWEALYTEEANEAMAKIVKHSTVAKGKKRVKSKDKLAKNRIAVLQAVLERLIPSSEKGAKVEAQGEGADIKAQVATEEALIKSERKTVTVGKGKDAKEKEKITENLDSLLHEGSGLAETSDWPKVRTGVLVEFGALVDGPRAAIERAKDYYGSLEHPTMLGHTSATLVHPDLKAALERASTHLENRREKGEIDDDEWKLVKRACTTHSTPKGKQKGSYWSTVIRANQNAKHKLSEHSFGYAVDFLPEENPNVGKGGPALAPVEAVTGEDPTPDSTVPKDKKKPKGPMKEKTTDHMSAADAEKLAEEIHKASDDYKAAMQSEATLDPVLRTIAAKARSAAKLPALKDIDADAIFEAATQADAAAREKALKAALWPEGSADAKGTMPPELEPTVKTLAMIGGAFRASFKKGRAGDRVSATSEAKQGTVAAHGFMSLPPALVGALAGSDAGDLQWLGTSEVHDYMHFQLRQRPPLPGPPPVADDSHAKAD